MSGFNYGELLKEFSLIQEKMLYRDKDAAQQAFDAFYKKTDNHFKEIFEVNKNTVKEQDTFLQKKQAQMILRYCNELNESNRKLFKLSDNEIIKIFEKQYKFKKVIRKFAEHL